MGKLWVRNFLRPPPLKTGKTFCAPPFKVTLWWFGVYVVKLRWLCHLSWDSDLLYMSNERLFFPLMCSVNADAIRFIHQNI